MHEMDPQVMKEMAARYVPVLTNIMAPNNQVRWNAEKQIVELKLGEVLYPQVLASIAIAWNGIDNSLTVRQLAAVLLRRYVDQHWNFHCDGASKLVIGDDMKKSLMQIMMPSLSEPDPKIRDANAHVIACMAKWEWNDNWQDLLPTILDKLCHPHKEFDGQIQGSILVLNEVCHEMLFSDFRLALPQFLPMVVAILTSDELSAFCKIHALECLTTCINKVSSTVDRNDQEKNILPAGFMWKITEMLIALLRSPKWDGETCGLKHQIMTFLTSTLTFKSPIETNSSARVVEILKVVWELLGEAKEPYMNGFIKDDTADTTSSCTIYQFVLSVLQFVEEVFECGRYNKLVNKSMGGMVRLLVFYVQLSDGEVEQFTLDPDDLCEDDTSTTSVRSQCLHILENSCDFSHINKSFKTAIFSVLQEQLQVAQEMKKSGESNWWKLQEACYYVISCKQDVMLKCVDKVVGKSDILQLLSNFVIPDMNSDIPLLASRAILVCSCFSSLLPEKDAAQLMTCLLPPISPSGNEIMRIFSVRAIYSMYEKHRTGKTLILDHNLPAVFEACFLCVPSLDGTLLELMFELISILVQINPRVTEPHGQQLMQLMLDLIQNKRCDILLKAHFELIFNSIGPYGGCVEAIKQVWIPFICQVLNRVNIEVGYTELALEMLTCIVRHAKEPFNKYLLEQCFTPLLKTFQNPEDAVIYFCACECIRAFLRSSAQQLREFRNPQGQSGVEIIHTIILHLLNPNLNFGHNTYVGRLIASYLLNYSELLSIQQSDVILKSTLAKMYSSRVPSETESLMSVFIHLFHKDVSGTCTYLQGLEVVFGGKTPLEYVICSLCDRHGYFFTKYDVRASLIALSKILEFGLTTKHQALSTITTKGDEIFEEGGGVRTRQMALDRPRVFRQIPLFVRVYKLLLKEISHQDKDDEESDDDDFYATDGDSDDDDDDQQIRFLDDELNSDEGDCDCDDDEDDDEIVDTTLMEIDLPQFLSALVKKIAALNEHQSYFVPHLNQYESATLKKLLAS